MEILILFAVHWYTSLFMQTFFLHRYASHKMYTMSEFWERFFWVCNFLFQGTSYLSPRAYGVMHKMHHEHADTEEDPHSARHSHNIYEFMWGTKNVYTDIFERDIEIPHKYLTDTPSWEKYDQLFHSWGMRILWAGGLAMFYGYFAPNLLWYILYFVQLFMGPIHGAIVNWYCHKFGYKNYKHMDNDSTNIMPVDVIMMGESLHNNHHAKMTNPNFAHKWFEFDPTYLWIKLFHLIGIIQLSKQSST
jgi:stearoyl-CoA desaturase (delta-9 desaturase)